MAREIDPKDTTRVSAYTLWMKALDPMVTFFKTLDVTNLIQVSRRKHLKFNMLLDYCIGKAAVCVLLITDGLRQLWAIKAQFSTRPNWASNAMVFSVYFYLTDA